MIKYLGKGMHSQKDLEIIVEYLSKKNSEDSSNLNAAKKLIGALKRQIIELSKLIPREVLEKSVQTRDNLS